MVSIAIFYKPKDLPCNEWLAHRGWVIYHLSHSMISESLVYKIEEFLRNTQQHDRYDWKMTKGS
jgi:hypothetical protein